MDIKWLGHASFKITIEKKIIYIDPYNIKNRYRDADIVLITHSHYDHLSIKDIEKIIKSDTVLFAAKDGSNILKQNFNNNIITVNSNDQQQIFNFTIKTIPAYNVNKSFHPKSNGWLGYVIETENESIYHSGDSDVINEMYNVKAKILLLPIGGTYTMNYSEAAELVNKLNPELVIPMHYGSIVGSLNDAENFKKLIKKSKVEILRKYEN